jgi:hypothetical protein
MPIGSQSLNPYTPTNFAAVNGTQYKGQLDAATAIAANPAGSLYVYPNSPAAMNVLVDGAFNLPLLGQVSPFAFFGANAPSVVSIPAPGSNSYYACVYFDILLGTTGVVFGASSATPGLRVPNALWQVPLAFVNVTAGQTSIGAANIFDARSWVQPGAISYNLGTVAVNTAVNCQNASLVSVRAGFSNAAGFLLTLVNVRNGCNINVFLQNATGGSNSSLVQALMPDGTAFVVNAISATATTIWSTTGITVANNIYIAASGSAILGNIFFTLT